MILLDALYINNSGGKTLLDYLVFNLHHSGLQFFYLFDKRILGAYPFLSDDKCLYLPATLKNRYQFYKKNIQKFNKVFCFGNIPPTIKLKIPVYTYFHNVLFLDTSNAFSFKATIVLKLKAQIIKALKHNTNEWWVQSGEVKKKLQESWKIKSNKIKIMPFFSPLEVKNALPKEEKTFLYVSDGHPFKQHIQLLEAFSLLCQEQKNVKLRLTISSNYPQIINKINYLRDKGVLVENLGWLSREMLIQQYLKNQFFIFPSLRESFGLGLIEAAQAQLPIIAADLSYVHSVIEPLITFNPTSSKSMYLAMKQALSCSPLPSKLKTQNSIKLIIHHLR